MKNKNYDTVIFDLGRVLVDFDHHISAAKIAKLTGKDESWLYQLFFESELTKLFDEGKILPRHFYNEIKKLTGLDISFDEFTAIWVDIFKENKDVCAFAASLKNDYRLVLMSNVNKLQFEYIKRVFPVVSVMDALVLSYQVGAMKPDPKIYERAIKASQTSPERIIYTDDRPELIEGAKIAGIKSSFVFKDLNGFKSDLRKVGITIDEYSEVK
jgi:putative hydrolase of the HAD superfamily